MLVLSRKRYQKILIGEDVKVTVVQTKAGSVRLGVEAPREMPVIREELARAEDISVPMRGQEDQRSLQQPQVQTDSQGNLQAG